MAVKDAELAAFLESVELAVASIYGDVLPMVGDGARPALTRFQSHHTAYATAVAAIAGTAATGRANSALAPTLASRLEAVIDEATAMSFLFGLENQVAATYGFTAAQASAAGFVKLLAGIVPPTAARSALLGAMAGMQTPLLFPNGPVETTVVGDGSDVRLGFDPARFPVH